MRLENESLSYEMKATKEPPLCCMTLGHHSEGATEKLQLYKRETHTEHRTHNLLQLQQPLR